MYKSKPPKDKERILKAVSEEWLVCAKDLQRVYQPTSRQQLRKQEAEGGRGLGIFKVVKEKNCRTRILHLAKLPFKYERETKPFPDKQKLWEFALR